MTAGSFFSEERVALILEMSSNLMELLTSLVLWEGSYSSSSFCSNSCLLSRFTLQSYYSLGRS